MKQPKLKNWNNYVLHPYEYFNFIHKIKKGAK